jgi:DinB superfamily
LKLVNGLTPKQWSFRERPERWSIAENIGHLIAFEIFLARAIAKAIRGPAEPVKKARSATKEPIVLGLADSRSIRFDVRKAIFPIGK